MTLIRSHPVASSETEAVADGLPYALTALTGILAFALAVVSATLMISLSTTAPFDVTTEDPPIVMRTYAD
ncbi:hypothetical protein ELQ90_10075 [Labedella phragmitis]|uniref:Uncharacterized protein n=1 Tax=Labedella phragmitis TaxID=2498849 RepID=A0A3S3Z8J4_9MICO|nr:hypothetical protein [Labedella phragmitis]RWZ51125.1 hypothetical protein ELQ90_10075 [Labedella phragmitis]